MAACVVIMREKTRVRALVPGWRLSFRRRGGERVMRRGLFSKRES